MRKGIKKMENEGNFATFTSCGGVGVDGGDNDARKWIHKQVFLVLLREKFMNFYKVESRGKEK